MPRRSRPAHRPSGATASGCRSMASRWSRSTAGSPRCSTLPALARRLGVARVWVKNDSREPPIAQLQGPGRRVGDQRGAGLGLEMVGAPPPAIWPTPSRRRPPRAGLLAWIFIPDDLELGEVVGTAVYNPRLVRVRGTYDDVNRLCAQVADRFGWGIVNINLRGYYGEGSKTVAFEIAEQLGWRLPTAVVAPMAGGSLVTKLEKGFRELRRRPGVGRRAAPLRRAGRGLRADRATWWSGAGSTFEPVVPRTIARSIAIGNPADGGFAASAIRGSGGWAAGRIRRRAGEGDRAAGRDDAASSPKRRAGYGGGARSPLARRTIRPEDESCSASPATDSRPSRRCRAPCPTPDDRAAIPANWRLSMAVTFSLPTVLARLADGQADDRCERGDARRSGRRDRRAVSPAGAEIEGRGRRTLSLRDVLSGRRGHPLSHGSQPEFSPGMRSR